ncbi:hypothetical protein AMJ39_03840 [candidate division TA06 bacterium DG_24]|uniref:Cell division protein FtsX n=3 Tax=Bacteria division TA06 TaxID=1156500 RepID=A0A0S8JKP0_UNCT6|nr:MAG: hypothetical protein AMJ39_03840 [candidate division TA06 bacterium DG_24]KPK69228.1 MAG: hypothetical protein AMJ82_06100 [candidate division TA06 bacterium SM23_40]KPL10340.1 MAG: hypothetical protein AMJ71_03395 [candidate division TA06 bacterium SM1_40]
MNPGAGYALREGLRLLRHNRALSSISVGTIAVSLVFFGVFLIATVHLGGLIDWFREKVEIRVILDERFRADDAPALEERILSLMGVEQATFVSREQALEELRHGLGEDADVIDILDENPLPPSFRVEVFDAYQSPEHMASLGQKLSLFPGVVEVDYGEPWIVRLSRMVRTLIIVDVVLGIIVAASSIFVVSNTIRLAALARRDVIEIMQLVGATDSLVRSPFLVEGSVQGLLGGTIAAAVTALLYHVTISHLGGEPAVRPELFVLLIVFGTVLGLIGSGFSLRKIV